METTADSERTIALLDKASFQLHNPFPSPFFLLSHHYSLLILQGMNKSLPVTVIRELIQK